MKDKIVIVSIVLLLGFSTWSFFRLSAIPHIVYIRSADLIYSYEGMKEAQQRQEKHTHEMQSGMDTLELDFQKTLNKFNQNVARLSKEERSEQEKLLGLQQNHMKQYSEQARGNLKKQDEELTQGVLNQVNSFVRDFGKKKGYDVILGTTNSGNLLYAKDNMDITDEVLKALNEQYKFHPDSMKK